MNPEHCLRGLATSCRRLRVLFAVATLTAAAPPTARAQVLVRVSAAMSLKDALTQAASAFEHEHADLRVQLNFAASSALVRQLAAGARCDLFISADRPNMQRVVQAGVVIPKRVELLLRNELVVVIPHESALTLASVEDLKRPELRRIALCNEAVPIGHYSRECLRRVGLLNALAGRVVTVDHVRAALAAVESGAADAAIVYRTDALVSRRCRIALTPPPSAQPRIAYFAAVTEGATSSAATDFLSFLHGPAAGAIFKRAGFLPVDDDQTVDLSAAQPLSDAAGSLTGGLALGITLRTLLVGSVATLVTVPIGIAIALALARRRFFGRSLVQALVTLPMVLPPVAVGLLLLKFLSPQTPWANAIYTALGGNPLFTWRAAAIAAAVMGAPLLIRTAEAAFAGVPRRLELAAASLGASRLRVFFTITLPLAARGVAYGVLLCFLRAVGEFGATTLVAGNIPGQTETLALAIYSREQGRQDAEAMILVAISIAIAVVATVLGEVFLRRPPPAEAVRELQPQC